MKIQTTVAWANVVELDVDEARLKDPSYLDECRNTAVSLASNNINWKDGVVTDCNAVPELCE